jgi:hypothetical protein
MWYREVIPTWHASGGKGVFLSPRVENASTLTDFRHLIEREAIDFIQPSPAKMSGFTKLRDALAFGECQ